MMMDSKIIRQLDELPNPSPQLVGGKGMGLLELSRLGLNVLPVWVIPTTVYTSWLTKLGIEAELAALEQAVGGESQERVLSDVRSRISSAALPGHLLENLRELQQGWSDVYGPEIIIRSSATVEDNVHHSFAGIFESIPCRTEQEMENAIHRVWASVFSPRAFAYYGIAGLKQLPSMALLVQPFVAADRSGVMFSRFSRPGHGPEILVEHVAGAGEKLVTGKVNPDRLWIRRWPAPGSLSETGPLSPSTAFELAGVAKRLEDDLGPQDVEWCLKGEQLYILQTRPITADGDTTSSSAAGEVLLQGVGASRGQAGGAVHLVFNIEDADSLVAGQVLTTTMTNPDMVPSMQRSAAVVTDVGGMICHAAIVSRELGIPCVVGTKSATQILTENSIVTVDGGAGLVFRGLTEAPMAELPRLSWADLWAAWSDNVPEGTLPLLPTLHAMEGLPEGIFELVVDPYSDLALDPAVEIESLASLDEARLEGLLSSYRDRLAQAVQNAGVETLYLDFHRLPASFGPGLAAVPGTASKIQLLELQEVRQPWQLQSTLDGRIFALMNGYSAELKAPGADRVAIPLGFGLLFAEGVVAPPAAPEGGPQGMFGMMPEARMAPMPSRARREAMHRLVPVLSRAHGGQVPASEAVFPWLNIRPEVIISPFLKAFVTPGVESLPFVMGFPDPPLHIQFMHCRFHFRQDALGGFFPKLMEMTWNEEFLSRLLVECRKTYLRLEEVAATFPASADELSRTGDEALSRSLIDFWNAFSEFFSWSFFIQAQGDDCVFPILGKMAEGSSRHLQNAGLKFQLPGLSDLTAPVTPVITAEYMSDLQLLKQTLDALGLDSLDSAMKAVELDEGLGLRTTLERVRDRWHWMRERDPYYDPYDTLESILEKGLSIRNVPASDYESNRRQSVLALALHFDLARLTGTSEMFVYGVKYGRALAIDRENHHLVWLRTSYRMRKTLVEWEARLRAQNDLQNRDIFFLTPWEILDAIGQRSHPLPAELMGRLRNRRLAYESEIQLKSGMKSDNAPAPEEDYF